MFNPDDWQELCSTRFLHLLPKLIGCRIVLKAGRRELLHQVAFIDIHIFTQSIQRGVVVAEFHIDDAEQHHRVVGKCFHTSGD